MAEAYQLVLFMFSYQYVFSMNNAIDMYALKVQYKKIKLLNTKPACSMIYFLLSLLLQKTKKGKSFNLFYFYSVLSSKNIQTRSA